MIENDRNSAQIAMNLLNTVFQSNLSEDTVFNKHFNNPYKIMEPIRFYNDERGKAIGTNSFMGAYLIDNITCQRHYVTQSNDTAVLHDQRGKGIFTKIVTEFEETDKESEFIFGIPNINSYPGFLKMGWIKVTDLSSMQRRNTLRNFVCGYIDVDNNDSKILFSDSKYHIEISKRIFFSNTDLGRINSNQSIMIERTNEYINWKLSKVEARILFVKEHDTILGYLIYHFHDKKKYSLHYRIAIIDDWYYSDKDYLGLLMTYMNRISTYSVISIINPNDNEYKDFCEMGFRKIKSSYCPLIVSPRGKNYHLLKKFSMRYLDSDTILDVDD